MRPDELRRLLLRRACWASNDEKSGTAEGGRASLMVRSPLERSPASAGHGVTVTGNPAGKRPRMKFVWAAAGTRPSGRARKGTRCEINKTKLRPNWGRAVMCGSGTRSESPLLLKLHCRHVANVHCCVDVLHAGVALQASEAAP
jgi:hypothetical protein